MRFEKQTHVEVYHNEDGPHDGAYIGHILLNDCKAQLHLSSTYLTIDDLHVLVDMMNKIEKRIVDFPQGK